MNLSLIVAVDKNRWIGKDWTLPWNYPQDLAYFKKITTTVPDPKLQNVVVMWKNTWFSIPEKFRPLPWRINVVISTSQDLWLPEWVIQVNSLEKLKSTLSSIENVHKVFIIGWQSLYNHLINDEDLKSLYITEIHDKYECDTFFPQYKEKFKEIFRERNVELDFTIYKRI